MNPIQVPELAHQIADRAVICDIESEGHLQTDAQGRRWYDTRPLLDPREQPDDCIEMFRQALGVRKYGTTVDGNPLTLREWLQHAYEETLDQAVYLRRAIEQIDRELGR